MSPKTVLNPTVNGKFKDFSRLLSVFQVLSRQILFSKTLQDSPVHSSTFQACANPEHFETDFLVKVSIKILNSGIILSSLTHDHAS